MEGTEEGDDTDELFVRPVVRIAAPAPVLAERGPSNAEIGGKRQRSQVQRLRSSELAGRNSTSPTGSPRGTVAKGSDGPPSKVAKHSPGGTLRVNVENGVPPLGKGSPRPGSSRNSPAAGSPVAAGGTGKKWEATTCKYLAKHGSRSPAPSPRGSSAGPDLSSPSSNGISADPAVARGHASRGEETPSVRSRNPARTPDVRKPPRVPGAPLSGDKSGGSRGNGNGGEWSKFGGGGSAGRNEARSSGGGVGASVGKSKEVSFGGTKSQALRTTDAAQVHSKLPPTVTPEQLPELMAKVKSAAAPEVVAGAKGLWGLVCNGYLELVAKGPALLDSLALIITSGTTQGRFYALAVAGELAYFSSERSQRIAGHAGFRSGLVRVLREGKGIEGEAAKVVRNTSANHETAACLWASEPGLVQGMIECAGASSHIRSCVMGAIYAMSRTPDAARLLGDAGVEKLLEPCLKETIVSDQGADLRDRGRVTLACAAMALLCIRDSLVVPKADASAASVATPSDAQAPDGASSSGAKDVVVKDEEQGARAAETGGAAIKDRAFVLERRALIQLVRVLQSAVDSVVYGGVCFSLEAALHALPAAVSSSANVALLCELGIVELLVAVVKQFSTEAAKDNAQPLGPPGAHAPSAPAAPNNVRSTNLSDTRDLALHLRPLALCVNVMCRICSSDLGSSTQALCVQRLNIVGAHSVMTKMVELLESKQHAADASSVAPASPPSSKQPSLSETSASLGVAASCSVTCVLHDAAVILQVLSQAPLLASP